MLDRVVPDTDLISIAVFLLFAAIFAISYTSVRIRRRALAFVLSAICLCAAVPGIASASDEFHIYPSGDTHVKLTSAFEGVTGDKDAIYIPIKGEDGGSGSVRVPTNWKATIQYRPAITWKYTYKCGITVDGKLEGHYQYSYYYDTGMKATVATPTGINAIRKAMKAPFEHTEKVQLYITVANACEYLGDVKRYEWRDSEGNEHVDFVIPDPVVMKLPEAKAGLFRVFQEGHAVGITVILENLEYSTVDYGRVLILCKNEVWTPVELRITGKTALENLHRYFYRAEDKSIYGFTRPGSDEIYVTPYELECLDSSIKPKGPPIKLSEWAGRKSVRVIKSAA